MIFPMFLAIVFFENFGCFIRVFPVFYDDFFIFCAQIDRDTMCHRLIKFMDVLTSYVVLPLSSEVSLYHS